MVAVSRRPNVVHSCPRSTSGEDPAPLISNVATDTNRSAQVLTAEAGWDESNKRTNGRTDHISAVAIVLVVLTMAVPDSRQFLRIR